MAEEPVAKRHQPQEEFSEELLRMYYDRIFPANLMCRWLSYGSQHEENAGARLLPHREFSFTTGDDVYIRYLSYEDAAGLKKDLMNKLPHKIDIGAVFSAAPRDHKKYKLFEPLQREFIIDIDLTDYDFLDVDVKRLETCDRCWPLMALALRVLSTSLREDFGFEHLMWVYSGRRGIHCWVCDTAARVMSNEVRSAVADYLGPKLNAATGRLAISIPMHPVRVPDCLLPCPASLPRPPALPACAASLPAAARTAERALTHAAARTPTHHRLFAMRLPARASAQTLAKCYSEELLPFFDSHILGAPAKGGFGVLDTEANQKKLLEMLCDEGVRDHFLDFWGRRPNDSGTTRWAQLTEYVRKRDEKLPSGAKRLTPVLTEIVFSYTYPRLDVNVSKGMNHLLKSPWAVHPKTGRVCVPLDPEMAARFDPSSVPTLRVCAEQMDAAHARGADLSAGKEISATTLEPYAANMEAFLKRSENSIRAEKVRAGKGSLDF